MAGESVVSQGSIEKRAEDLEVKQTEEATKAEADQAAADKVEADKVAAAEAAKKPVVKDDADKQPNDPKELRKWATRTSMELAEVRKQQEAILAAFNKSAKKPVDWKELAKDPAKLEKAIADREKELVDEHSKQYVQHINESTAEITRYEDQVRYSDKENYPQWAELKPLMLKLAEPNTVQPNGDPRINFNQHPKVVLDALYELAKDIAAKDPTFKKAEVKSAAATGKTFSQEEYDAAVAKAKEEAAAEASSSLRAEARGAGVGGMGKGSSKSQPGKVDKDALWAMPLGDLKNAIKRASDQ